MNDAIAKPEGRSGRALRRAGAVGAATTLAGGSALALMATLAGPAGASTFTVTEATDDGTGTVSGTLSWAIAQANADAAADVIDFSPSLSTITFSGSASQVVISESLTIDGPGSDALTVDFANNCGLRATFNGAATFEVSGVTLTGGSATYNACGSNRDLNGGALLLYTYNYPDVATVTISDVTFDGNYAAYYGGGFSCQGEAVLTIENSSFLNNISLYDGGGAYLKCWKDVTFTGNTVSGNTSNTEAGGVFFRSGDQSTATIVDSTFTNNTANWSGGGLLTESGSTVIRNSTFSGNTADYGGAIWGQLDGQIIQSTITGNYANNLGGGVTWRTGWLSGSSPVASSVDIIMSTVSGNSAAGGNGNEFGMFRVGQTYIETTIVGSIVSGTTVGSAIAGAAPNQSYPASNFPVGVSNSLIGAYSNTVVNDDGGNTTGVTDPQLYALADNGGATFTMEPKTSSPAIDAGPNPVPTFPGNTSDQRGYPYLRVSNGRVDIGSVETQPTPTPTSSTSSTSTSSTSTTSSSTTTTITPSPSTTIDVSPDGPATPVGGEILELPAGEAALIDPYGIVSELPIVPTGPDSIGFGITEIGAELGGDEVSDGTRLALEVGGDGTGDGFGFQSGSTASVWIMSDPHLLGTATVDAEGNFDIPFVVPGDLEAGTHTIQLQGIGSDGLPRALSAGVTVDGDGSGLPVTGRDLALPIALGGGLLLAGGAGVAASRRARRA